MINPTKIRLRNCTIKGVDCRLHTNCITVYETMCKPYITATITLIDNNGFVNGLQLKGGEQVSFAFDGGGRVYESTQYITQIEDPQQSENLRSTTHLIHTATESYFNDKANLVQRSDVNTTASSVAQQIHNQFVGTDAPLKVLQSTLGMIAKSDIGGFITANKKPFKAIEDIMSQASYGKYKSGSTVYFRDRDSYVLAPLEHLFETMSPQATFVQKKTWGADWRDTFTSTNAIIAARTVSDENSQRGGASKLAATASGGLNIFDIAKGTNVVDKIASKASGVLSQFAKRGGGIPNVLQTDSRRNELSSDQAVNQVEQNSFQASVKDGVNYLIKVPIQSGIDCTVGKAINAKLIAPVGDQNTPSRNYIGGLMLVADLMHECYFDDRSVQATTTMRAVQKDYNV